MKKNLLRKVAQFAIGFMVTFPIGFLSGLTAVKLVGIVFTKVNDLTGGFLTEG